jgi:RNA polymerase sigma-70 factor (ECF subfamily)
VEPGEPSGPGEFSEGDDWRLLARCAAGDFSAFDALVGRHQDRLYRVCARVLGDREEARDAVQDVFLKLFRKAGELRPRGQLFTLLYRIAVNHCLNRIRRRRLARFLPFGGGAEEETEVAFDPPDPRADPVHAAQAKERWHSLRRAIEELPPGQRVVLLLARFEGLSQREIARVLEISEGAVESRLVRAMRTLEKSQEKAGFGVS